MTKSKTQAQPEIKTRKQHTRALRLVEYFIDRDGIGMLSDDARDKLVSLSIAVENYERIKFPI